MLICAAPALSLTCVPVYHPSWGFSETNILLLPAHSRVELKHIALQPNNIPGLCMTSGQRMEQEESG